MPRMVCRWALCALVALPLSACAANTSKLEYDDKEVFKQGYFPPPATAGDRALYTTHPAASAQCIAKHAVGAPSGFQVRLEAAYLRTYWNPDRITGLMHIPPFSYWLHGKRNDIGLFIAVSTDNSVGFTDESAYLPVDLERNIVLTRGAHIGSPNRLLYLSKEYNGNPVHLQLRMVDFDDGDIDTQFAVLQKMMGFGQQFIATANEPGLAALGALGSEFVAQKSENDVLGVFDFTLMPCTASTSVPLPPLAEGYIVMIRDESRAPTGLLQGKSARMQHNVDWADFSYDPATKALLIEHGYYCLDATGRRSAKHVATAAECANYKEKIGEPADKSKPNEKSEVAFPTPERHAEPFTDRTYIVLSITRT